MSSTPPAWASARIRDLCRLENGRAFKPSDWTTTGLPIVRIQNLNDASRPFNHFAGDVPERYRLRGGELLFAWSGTPGTSFGAHIWRGGDAVLNQHIFRVDFDPSLVEKRFFRHAINHRLDELIHVAHGGVGLRHVTKGVFEGTTVLVPPLSEQRRIADKLDALLARVDGCRQRLDRVPVVLKRFRQSVLAAATRGDLTREWREERSRSVDAWESTTVASLLDGKPRNGYSPRAVDRPTPVRSLTLTATTKGRFRGEYFKYIDERITAESHLWLVPGDILIQRANTLEHVGVSAVFDGPARTYVYPDLMMKCRANSRVLTEYLYLVLSSDPVRAFFRENATGTAGNMPKINQQTVLQAPALLPPIDEQQEVVRRAQELFALADAMEEKVETMRSRMALMPATLLAKAFRGDLVPRDPNDEPASVMLERHRAKRAMASDEEQFTPSRRASSPSTRAARLNEAPPKSRRAS